MKKNKHICLIITLFLVINNPLIALAESAPGTISVSGGSVGSGGVEGNSTILKGTALTVIMATLASAGITIKVAQDDYERGVGAFSYLQNKFNEWENQSSQGWANYEALNGTKVGADGKLYIPEAASSIMQKFVNWLYGNEDIKNLPQAESPDTVNGAYYGSVIAAKDNAGKDFEYVASLNGNTNFAGAKADPLSVAWVQSKEGNYYVLRPYYPDQSFYVYRSDGSKLSTILYDGRFYSMQRGLWDKTYNAYVGIPIVANFYNYIHGLNGAWDIPEGTPVITNTGFYTDNADIPKLVDETGNGKILVVNPGLIGSVQDSYIGSNDSTIGIQDYLDALKDLYGQQALPQDITDLPDITISGEDAITGTDEEVAVIDRDIPIYPGITIPSDPDSITWPDVPPIAMPVADPDVPADPSVAIPAMSLDLRNYFPFCIPFDIYNLLAKLNSEPVTPVVNIDWGDILGVVGIDYVMTIDLHDYDGLASLLRTMELFGFVIGLGVATRSIYLRG